MSAFKLALLASFVVRYYFKDLTQEQASRVNLNVDKRILKPPPFCIGSINIASQILSVQRKKNQSKSLIFKQGPKLQHYCNWLRFLLFHSVEKDTKDNVREYKPRLKENHKKLVFMI